MGTVLLETARVAHQGKLRVDRFFPDFIIEELRRPGELFLSAHSAIRSEQPINA